MKSESEYKWIPKNGVSLEAIERMQKHFQKPKYPMGEAWFIGKERRLYTELINKPFTEIEPSELSTNVLFEIASGTQCFGHREEWDEWFKYLLPQLILRCQEFYFFNELLAQSVVTAFMSIYWNGIPDEYKGFRNDVINTLSLCLMNEILWFDYLDEKTKTIHLRAFFLDTYKDGNDQLRLDWNTGKANESLSALMFFCLKYLNPEEISFSTKSLFAIDDIYWKGALMVWLLGAYDILDKPIVVPSMIEKSNPEISWENSHVLGSRYGSIDAEHPPAEEYNDNKDFLPTKNSRCFLIEIRKKMTDDLILDWAESFAQDKFVAESTSNVPELLMDKLSKNK